MDKHDQNPPAVILEGGVPVTTTLAIAEGGEVEHASVIKLVRSYLDDLAEFGLVRFEIRPREAGKHGGGDTEYAILNEQQTTLLFTYMKNTAPVRTFKKRLVKEFYELALAARQPTPSLPLPAASPHPEDLAAALRPFLEGRAQTTMPEIMTTLFPATPDHTGLANAVGRALKTHFPEWQRRRAQTPDGARPWIYQRRAGLPPRAQAIAPPALPAPASALPPETEQAIDRRAWICAQQDYQRHRAAMRYAAGQGTLTPEAIEDWEPRMDNWLAAFKLLGCLLEGLHDKTGSAMRHLASLEEHLGESLRCGP